MRALLVLAIATVLSGVPSSVFAAGNELSAADASPRSGTTLAPFTLSVEYHGGFPALSVTADAAGRAFPMLLASGSLSDGRWSATALLPAGTWTVRFAADASLGNDPSLDGPSLTVQGASSPAPAPSSATNGPGPAPTFSNPANGGGGADDPSPAQAPAAPVDGAASPVGEAAVPAGTTPPDSAESAPGDVPAAIVGGAAQPTGGPVAVTGPSSPTMASTAPEATPHGAQHGAAGGPAAATASMDEPPSALVPIAAALAALAILATFVVLARRRRRPAPEPASANVALSIDDEVTAALHRRTLRRSRRRLDEDPIVASLGVTSNAPPTPTEGGTEAPSA